MRIRKVLVLLNIIISLGAATWASPTAPITLHYKVSLKSQSFGDMGTRELWLKGNKMCWDVQSAKLPLRILKNEHGVFLIHSWDKIAGQYPDGSPRGNPKCLLPGPNGSPEIFLKSVNAVKLRRQKLGKQLCDVYSYTEPVTNRKCKLWVNTKLKKPVKIFLEGKHKVMDPITITYIKFEEGISIADSFFDLPKGYAIRPMPKLDYKKNNPKPNNEKSGV